MNMQSHSRHCLWKVPTNTTQEFGLRTNLRHRRRLCVSGAHHHVFYHDHGLGHDRDDPGPCRDVCPCRDRGHGHVACHGRVPFHVIGVASHWENKYRCIIKSSGKEGSKHTRSKQNENFDLCDISDTRQQRQGIPAQPNSINVAAGGGRRTRCQVKLRRKRGARWGFL